MCMRICSSNAFVRFGERAARQYGRQVLAVGRRRVDVVDRIKLPQRLAQFAQPLVVDFFADQCALDVAGAQRRRAHAAEGERRAGDFAGGVFLKQRRGGDDGEIAVAAGKFDEGGTVPRRPGGKDRASEKLVGPERRGHIGDRERGKIDGARAALAGDRDFGVERSGDRNQLCRRIEMAQRAAERAAVAGLAVPDPGRWPRASAGSGGTPVRRIRCRAHASSPDLQRAILLADIAQAVDAVEIDHVIGQHVAHIEHRHQRLAAGQQFGIVEARQQRDGVGHAARIVI